MALTWCRGQAQQNTVFLDGQHYRASCDSCCVRELSVNRDGSGLRPHLPVTPVFGRNR